MTEELVPNMVTINGKEYEEDALADNSKYFIAQIRDLQAKQGQLQFQMDQVQAALNAMTNALIGSVESSEDTDDEQPSVN